ncbi:MAG: GlgB N-terminal domain-containing protein, partial [Acidimicrobiia bacterium]
MTNDHGDTPNPGPRDPPSPQPTADPVAREVSLLLTGEHGDPHHVLGLHPDKDATVIRAYR